MIGISRVRGFPQAVGDIVNPRKSDEVASALLQA